jgi:hypothetical protein
MLQNTHTKQQKSENVEKKFYRTATSHQFCPNMTWFNLTETIESLIFQAFLISDFSNIQYCFNKRGEVNLAEQIHFSYFNT